MDFGIVGEIVGYGLIAMPKVAGPEWRIRDFHGSDVACLGGPVRRRQRQRILEFRNVLLKDGQLPALGLIADQDRGAIRGLYAEQIVEIGLIRREYQVEFRIFEVEPGQIAFVVVVGEKRIGA